MNHQHALQACVWPLAITLFVPALLPAAATLGAQSLAEVARQEEARRKEIRQPAKVYTNKDLANVPPPAAPAAAPAPSEKPATPAAADAKDDAKAPPPAQDAKDQGACQRSGVLVGADAGLLAQLDRDQTYADAMQTRINALTADFTRARRSGAARGDRPRSPESDRRARSPEAGDSSDQKAIADLEEEARRAAVPPGWLR